MGAHLYFSKWLTYVVVVLLLILIIGQSNGQYYKLKRRNKKLLQSENDVKAIAILFPQFHQIPENDKFWGEGFTEWTFLKPMPRKVNGIVMRKPHEDIGYYNLLNYSHRKYVRDMANHFGIYGFCFYHFWFKDHPILHLPVNKMFLDGEPKKPFFFCWATEAWTSRWDGGRDHVLIGQDYTSEEGNIKHFNYLLPFFKHDLYITEKGMPIFAIYRVEEWDLEPIQKILTLFNKLAIENGLLGIYFMRFYGPFNNKIESSVIKGFIHFEPGLSMGNKQMYTEPAGPSIFEDGKFNVTMYKNNNWDLASLSDEAAQKHYELQISPEVRIIRTRQFKVYDKVRTWRAIENVALRPTAYRGTFVNWNNAPRRNFTNKNYRDYPTSI